MFERSGAVFGAPGATGRGHLAVGGGGGAGGGGRQDPPDYRPEVNQQIAQALTQLQQDMTSVLSRLNTLEALTVAQTQVRSKRFDEALRTCILFKQTCNFFPYFFPNEYLYLFSSDTMILSTC